MKTLFAFLLLFLISHTSFTQPFKHITTAGPVGTQTLASVGGSWNDVDGDGFDDLLITGFAGQLNNRHYSNLQDGVFAEDPNSAFMLTPGNWGCVVGLVGDYDNDGDQDVMMCSYEDENHQPVPLRLLTNLGGGAFQPISSIFEKGSFPSGTWVDYDLDGDLDFFAAAANGSTDLFYQNTGADLSSWLLMDTLSFLKFRSGFITHDSWVDLDEDGDLDLYIANFGPPGNNANTYHRSMLHETGDPNYFIETQLPGLTGENGANIGVNWVDYDNDLDLDIYLNYYLGKDRLYRNDGSGVFTQIAGLPMLNVTAYTNFNTWADFDLDGDLDLVLAHQLGGTSMAKIYRNEHIPAPGVLPGSFTLLDETASGDLSQAVITNAQSAGYADYDNDGDVDLYIVNTTNQNLGAPNFLFKNEQAIGNNWLKIKLVGSLSNRNGYGASIRVTALIAGDTVRQMRFVSGGTGSYSFQNSIEQHFGLGDADTVISLEIGWPSGQSDFCTNLSANQSLIFEEGGCLNSSVDGGTNRQMIRLSPNPGNENTVEVSFGMNMLHPVHWLLFEPGGRQRASGIIEPLNDRNKTYLTLPSNLQSGLYFIVFSGAGSRIVLPWVKN